MRKSVGIVGCGTIGQPLLREADAEKLPVSVTGFTSRTESRARSFLSTLWSPPPYLGLKDLIDRADLVVETAGGQVVPQLAGEAFGAGKNLVVHLSKRRLSWRCGWPATPRPA